MRMNKVIRIVWSFLLVALLFTCVSCGKVIKSIDKNKTQIYIQIYNGGYGEEWIDPVIEAFEADYPKYEVIAEGKKYSTDEIEQMIVQGTQYCAFMGYTPDWHSGIYSDLFAGLTDILEMDVDGNGKTVYDKMYNKEEWLTATSKNGEGCYALPYGDSLTGFVYDHEMFVKNGFLYFAENTETVKQELTAQGIRFHADGSRLIFDGADGQVNYEQGDPILRAGKDGLYGTYDDGQPITESEFQSMVDKIAAQENAYPFLYSGKIIDYTTDIFTAVFAQYDGIENYKTFNTYEGTYTFAGESSPTTITPQNGYKVYNMVGIEKAFSFMDKYFFDEEYAHPQSFISESSHTDAQSYFLLGAAMTSKSNPFAGMLVDGVYWEAESRTIASMLEKRGYEDYGYGKHDFRYMLLPYMEGQNGDVSHSVMVARDTSSFVVNAKLSDELLEMTKLFCAYTLKDEFLRNFTVSNGCVRPYEYTLTEEEWNSLSPFAQNCYNMYRDNEHISIARPWLSLFDTPMSYATAKGTSNLYYSIVDKLVRPGVYDAIRFARSSDNPATKVNPAKAAADGMYEYYKNNWSGYYASYVEFLNNN